MQLWPRLREPQVCDHVVGLALHNRHFGPGNLHAGGSSCFATASWPRANLHRTHHPAQAKQTHTGRQVPLQHAALQCRRWSPTWPANVVSQHDFTGGACFVSAMLFWVGWPSARVTAGSCMTEGRHLQRRERAHCPHVHEHCAGLLTPSCDLFRHAQCDLHVDVWCITCLPQPQWKSTCQRSNCAHEPGVWPAACSGAQLTRSVRADRQGRFSPSSSQRINAGSWFASTSCQTWVAQCLSGAHRPRSRD